MANSFNLELDTTGVSNPTISIQGGATYITTLLADLTIGCGDGVTTGYEMLIWGSVDNSYDANIQTTEGASQWITYNTTKQIKLSSGDGEKTISLKIRDDVSNGSSTVLATINLDMTLPTVTVTGWDVPKISKIAGKNVCSFSFSSSDSFKEFKVKVVPSTGSTEDVGTVIAMTNGSTNMSGNAGNYPAATPINCTINGADLQTASSGDGVKIIKVFVRESITNLWSV